MAAENTSKGVKRKRGPYLSYLANPLQHEVPRSTLRFWSRELCEENIEENRDESCSLEFTTSSQNMYMVSSGDADSNNTDAESIEEGRENETLVVDEEGTKILDEQADCINSPEESDNSAENAEAKGNETTAENITTIDEPVYGMYLPEDAEIETTIDPDDSLYLRDDEIAFADDCEEETWEELWENDENIEEANDVLQENQQGEMEEKPLYTGARITLGVSLLLIITFAMRHQLSGIALTDLLTLIDIHLIAPNCFTRSMATLHKFFKQLKNPVQFHYYCSFCYEYIGIDKQTCCTNKHCLRDLTKKNSLSYFIVIPLEPQLEALLASKYM